MPGEWESPLDLGQVKKEIGLGPFDRLLLFVAPIVAGDGPFLLGRLSRPVALRRLRAEPVGADVLLDAYVHEP
jgi:riboflavin biosynthesis pyrimidine reductase